jgi:hypothetical protein
LKNGIFCVNITTGRLKMKRAETILKEINDLGYELHNNYSHIEIKNAIIKLEKRV